MSDRSTQRPGACTILRTFVVTYLTATGRETGSEVITAPCNAPLFARPGCDYHRKVCGTCRGGWETSENRFASEDEKRRAMNDGVGKTENNN